MRSSNLTRVVVCGAALALAGLAVADAKLTRVETRKSPSGLTLQIVGTDLAQPKLIKVGKTYIYEFKASLPGTGKTVKIDESGLHAYKYFWFSSTPKLVRVQIWPTDLKNAKPIIVKNEDGWQVSWNGPIAHSQSAKAPVAKSIEKAPVAKVVDKPVLKAVATKVTTEKAAPATKLTTKKLPALHAKVAEKATVVKSAAHTVVATKPAAKQINVKKSDAKTAVKTAAVKPVAKTRVLAPTISTIFSPVTDNKKPVAKNIDKPKGRLVSLDFVNTDVVQILKALAMQSRVNVVTAPEVKGTLTVSLDKVRIEQALDLVTTLAGLSYQLVSGNTYIVASKDKIGGMVRSLTGETINMVSRVVPIYSGEGTQIKAAIIRSARNETTDGTYEIALPSEETKVEGKSEDKVSDDPTKTGGDNKESKIETKATSGQKDLYVVVLGSPKRVEEISQLVRALDEQFCMTLGKKVPTSSALVTRSYNVRGGPAIELMKAVAGEQKKVGNVELSATPAGSTSEQVIVLNGRETEVNELMATLNSLDSAEQIGAEFFMYDVRFADPRDLREQVVSQVPGIRATIPPASAGNPRLYQAGIGRAQASDMVKNDPANGQAGGTAGSAGSEIDPKAAGDTGAVSSGLIGPFKDMERAAVPMRLVLRGTPDQLRMAQTYLATVDIAPKQVALELRVMELSKEDALRIGIDWNIFTGGAVSAIRFNQSSVNAGANSATGRISSGNFGATVTATLDSIADKNRLIARPNLLAIDGRESEIFVGDIVRYIQSKTTNPTTGELNITIAEIPVGVRLAVMPRIGSNGELTMDLRPVVSSITGFLNAGNGVQIPQTSSRVAQSTVNIASGETIAIGGLIQDTDVRNISKVPFLGDLPIIGALFRRTDNSRVRREVVFFLTAREITAADRGNAADPREAEKKNPTEMPPLKKNGN